jgi:hypothetical protein
MSAVTSLEANRKHLHVARGRYAERLKVQHAAPKIGDELHPIGFNRSERSQPIVRWLSSFRLLAVCLLSLPDRRDPQPSHVRGGFALRGRCDCRGAVRVRAPLLCSHPSIHTVSPVCEARASGSDQGFANGTVTSSSSCHHASRIIMCWLGKRERTVRGKMLGANMHRDAVAASRRTPR